MWVREQGLEGNFRVNFTSFFFAFFLPPVSHSCSFGYGLKGGKQRTVLYNAVLIPGESAYNL